MNIALNEPGDWHAVTVSGFGQEAVYPLALRFVGYRGTEVTSATPWFMNLDEDPLVVELGFEDLDRMVIEAVARDGMPGAWYGLHDLLVSVGPEDEQQTALLRFDSDTLRRAPDVGRDLGVEWGLGEGAFTTKRKRAVEHHSTSSRKAEGIATHAPGASDNPSVMAAGLPLIQPTVERTGDGPDSDSFPGDPHMAVGRTRVVTVINSEVQIYDKNLSAVSSGNPSLQDLFGSSGLADPRVVFDEDTDRFFISATDLSSRLFLAASPVDDGVNVIGGTGWTTMSFSTSAGVDAGKIPEHPTLGVNAEGVFLSAFMFSVIGSTSTIFSVDKASFLAGAPIQVNAFRGLIVDSEAIQPCVTGLNEDTSEFFVSRVNRERLRVYRLNPPLTNPTLFQVGLVPVPSHFPPPSAPQPGSSLEIDTVNARLHNAVMRHGSIWTAHTVGLASDSDNASIRWYEIDPESLIALQVGTISDEDLSFYFPTIAVNARRGVLVGFGGSGENSFVSSYCAARGDHDPPGETSLPLMWAAGTGPYEEVDQQGFNRWGDYSATAFDPFSETRIWTIQARASTAIDEWRTRIGEFSFCEEITNYCIAAPNSTGLGAEMGFQGNTSISSDSLVLTASQLPAEIPGLFFLGTLQVQAVFGNGFRCAAGAVTRLFPLSATDASGFVSRAVDLSSMGIAVSPGDRLNFQFWYRDSAAGGLGFNLTDGLEIEFCP